MRADVRKREPKDLGRCKKLTAPPKNPRLESHGAARFPSVAPTFVTPREGELDGAKYLPTLC